MGETMEKVLSKIKNGMNWLLSRIAAVLLVAMTLLVIYQVFTRYVLNNPSAFTEEVVRYLLMWTGFIGAAYAFSVRGHMALVFLRDKLPENRKKILVTLTDLLVFLFALFVMVIGGVKLALSAAKEFSALLGIPRTLVYSMAPISGVFIMVAQAINIYEDITGKTVAKEDRV